MKSNYILNLVIVFLLALLVLNSFQAAAPVPAAAQSPADECSDSRWVQVSGAAVVYVIPDRALVQLGVQSNGATPDLVQDMNFREIQKVVKVIRDLGVDAKDIATDYYIVYPVYDDYSSLSIKGYRIDNTISITLRDVNLVDDVVLAALKVGANEIQDVQFYTSELRKYRDQARDLAMKAASEKAQALAGAAGTQAGCVLNINENTWSQYYGSWRGGRQAAMYAQNVAQNSGQTADPGSEDSPINLGQIAIRAEVNATVSMK